MATRVLTEHLVTDPNVGPDKQQPQVLIDVCDEPGSGGANHAYEITTPDGKNVLCRIDFQNGPIADKGVNGVTHEALLAIVLDRLQSFQRGPYPSDYNQQAMEATERALTFLKLRTRDRQKRGVEGKLAE